MSQGGICPNPLILYTTAIQTTGATFQINSAKLYIPVVTLSVNNNIKFLENIKQVFKGTIFSNKYRSEIATQTKNNKLNYLIVPTFRNAYRLFVLSFKTHMPLVEIKDFNSLIDN